MEPAPVPPATCESPAQYLSPTRTALETLLWLAIIAAYLPQYRRIRQHGTAGLSPYYVLNHGLFSTTTLALRLGHSVFFPAFNCVASGELRGWKAYSAILGFVDVVVQWLCAVFLLIVYVRHRPPEPNEAQQEQAGSAPASSSARPRRLSSWQPDEVHAHKLSSRRMRLILTAYAALTLPPSAALLCLNAHPRFQGRGSALYAAFWPAWIAFLCAADAFLVAFQFVKQLKTIGRLRSRGALSVPAVAGQSAAFILLSMAQFFRSRRNIHVVRERHPSAARLLALFAYVYGCVSVDVMYLVAGLGYLVLFQLCIVFDWNELFGNRFGRIQLL